MMNYNYYKKKYIYNVKKKDKKLATWKWIYYLLFSTLINHYPVHVFCCTLPRDSILQLWCFNSCNTAHVSLLLIDTFFTWVPKNCNNVKLVFHHEPSEIFNSFQREVVHFGTRLHQWWDTRVHWMQVFWSKYFRISITISGGKMSVKSDMIFYKKTGCQKENRLCANKKKRGSFNFALHK